MQVPPCVSRVSCGTSDHMTPGHNVWGTSLPLSKGGGALTAPRRSCLTCPPRCLVCPASPPHPSPMGSAAAFSPPSPPRPAPEAGADLPRPPPQPAGGAGWGRGRPQEQEKLGEPPPHRRRPQPWGPRARGSRWEGMASWSSPPPLLPGGTPVTKLGHGEPTEARVEGGGRDQSSVRPCQTGPSGPETGPPAGRQCR